MAGRPKRRARLEAEARAAGKPIPERKDHRAEMTEKLVEQLEAGTAPWQKTWTAGSGGRPYNPLSADPKTASGERGYSGVNRMWLMMVGAGYGDDRWCTAKQAEEKGYKLREGEERRGLSIEVWKPYTPKAKEQPETQQDADVMHVPSRMGVRYYTVYNAQQFENFPPLERVEHTWTPVERAEQLIAASGAKVHHSPSEQTPHYSPGYDHIVMPSRERFESAEAYYDTATHELVHWTGHESRLDRHTPDARFGTPAYAREELVAEIGSMFLSADTGIPHNTEQHAAYVKSWIQLLRDDKNAVPRAAAQASKAVDFVLEREKATSAERALPAVEAAEHIVRAAGGSRERLVALQAAASASTANLHPSANEHVQQPQHAEQLEL